MDTGGAQYRVYPLYLLIIYLMESSVAEILRRTLFRACDRIILFGCVTIRGHWGR